MKHCLISVKLRRIVVYSVRYDRNGKLVNGRPCTDCVRFMIYLGLKKTVYSTDDSTMITSKLEDLQCIPSSGSRY
jgi:deoxycytidylate deaminase